MNRRRVWIGVLVAVIVVTAGVALVYHLSDSENVVSEPATSARPSTKPRAAGFPGPANTGLPDGVTLRPYDGPCTIETAGTVITDRAVGCDRLVVQAAGVTVSRSRLKVVDVDRAGASLVVEDSEIDGGTHPGAAVGYADVTLRRVEVRGGRSSVVCGTNCLIEDSWLHDQLDPVGDEHLNGFLSNGGKGVVLRRNTIECTPQDNILGGGCSGDAQIYGDFAALVDYKFEGNLFKTTPGGFCTSFGYDPRKKFGHRPKGIHVIDNVFERGDGGKCGSYGPATSFVARDGNVWKNNRWVGGENVAHT